MEKHIYFVRHGESESNADRILRGPHSMLTELGKKQAESVAKRMSNLGIETIISSPLVRARHTAQAIAAQIQATVEESALFMEYERPSITFGKHELDPEVIKVVKEIYEGHLIRDYRHSDEESFVEIRERGIAALQLLEEHPATRICVVTHGFFMRVLCGLVLLGEGFSGREFQLLYKHLRGSNTGIMYVKRTEEDLWQLNGWNDRAHLG